MGMSGTGGGGGGGGYSSPGANYPWSPNYNPSNSAFRNKWRQQKAGGVPPSGGSSGGPQETGSGSAGSVGTTNAPPGPPPVNPGAPPVVNPGAGETSAMQKGGGGQMNYVPGAAPQVGASSAVPTNPGGNDFNRKLTEPEYQARWDDALSRGPVQTPNGRSDLPTWSEFFQQSGQFGTPMDPRATDSPYREGRMGANPMAQAYTHARLPGQEMEKWKGGKYAGDGKWSGQGTGGTRSGGGPSGQ